MHKKNSSPLFVSHRGIAANATENTLHAFLEAARLGVDMIEMDAHETMDGQLIVHHDPSLSSFYPSWDSLTYADIRKLIGTGQQAPLLTECASQLAGTPLNIEVKSYRNCRSFAAALRAVPLPRGSIISSYRLPLLRRLHGMNIGLPLFAVVNSPFRARPLHATAGLVFRNLTRAMPDFLTGLSVHDHLVSERLVRMLHDRGKQVHVWTVNHQPRMQQLMSWGVDAIISNRLDVLLPLRERTQSPYVQR